MKDILTIVYLVYMFISFYFLVFFILTFFRNRKEMFGYPKAMRAYSVSFLIPAYNEEESIQRTVETILSSDYPHIAEVIVVNDGSSDNTKKIVSELEKKYPKVKLFNKPNSGKADSLNQGIKIAKGELIAVVDADSYPSKDALSKMTGFFDEAEVGVVTTRIFVDNPKNFIQRLQAIEYKVIAFSRKLLGFVDAIYVTPGPLALYRKSALEKIHGFDIKNLTEDIEITWHLIAEGYKVRMSFLPFSASSAPDKFKQWFKQRLRWNVGGFQTILKYKTAFFKKGMLGYFILPFFIFSLLLGVTGLSIFLYRIFRKFFISYLSTKYTIQAEVALIRLQDINLHPSILHFFGITLFILGMIFIFLSLRVANIHLGEKESFFSVLFYSVIYITIYPIILIVSLYKFIIKDMSW